jgi:hypothetical protein
MENFAILEDLAYTVIFNANRTSPVSATLTFAVSSDWVKTNGWGDNGTFEITSIPSGAWVYIDGTHRGFTPLQVYNLSPGAHSLTLAKDGRSTSTTLEIRDKRDSIHVIRIADDGSGEVLNTTFIGHDPVRNLDFFRAESPNGLSTFGLASLSKSGNLFQILQFLLGSLVSAGGGSSGGPPEPTQSRHDASPSPTPSVTSTPAPQPTTTPSVKAPPDTPEIPPRETPSMPSETPGQSIEQTPPPYEQDWPNTLEFLRNISIVFVVIFVTIIFYYRWKQKEE